MHNKPKNWEKRKKRRTKNEKTIFPIPKLKHNNAKFLQSSLNSFAQYFFGSPPLSYFLHFLSFWKENKELGKEKKTKNKKWKDNFPYPKTKTQ
jgi:hypothetical protein